MSNIPIESPNKYGSFDDDLDELAAALGGRGTDSLKPRRTVDAQREQREVDTDFLRSLRDSATKYGR